MIFKEEDEGQAIDGNSRRRTSFKLLRNDLLCVEWDVKLY